MWPFHQVMLNGNPLPTSFVSKNELKATIAPEAIPTAGTYLVTLKCEGEAFPESHRAHLVVGFSDRDIHAMTQGSWMKLAPGIMCRAT